MSWILKHTRSDRPIAAEYLCPVHGRFARDVDRDENGEAPPELPCPAQGMGFADPRDAEFFEVNAVCGLTAPYVISAPARAAVKHWEVERGKWEKPERPTYFDTRKLGEGQPLHEFREERAKVWEEHRWRENKELLK